MQSIKNKVKDKYEVIEELQVMIKYQAEAIEQLQNQVQELVQLQNEISIVSKRQLEQGVEYISIIEEGSKHIDEFMWEDILWNKYLIKLNGIDEPFELIYPKHKRQPKIGEYISHYIVGKQIKQWKYVQS